MIMIQSTVGRVENAILYMSGAIGANVVMQLYYIAPFRPASL